MKIIEILRVAFSSLLRNKTRSVLTMLGIIIGVGAVIAVVAIGEGAQYSVQQQIKSLGTNVIMIHPGHTMRGGASGGAGSFNRLTEADVKAVRERCPSVLAVSAMTRIGAQIIYGNVNWATSVQGVYPEWLIIRDWQLASGTMFSDQDNRSGAKVCVLGKTVVRNLFPNEDPIDKIVRIRKMPFRVMGVLKEKGQNAFGQDQDDLIIAPFSTVQRKLQGSVYVGSMLVSARTAPEIRPAQSQISEVLRARMRVPPNEDLPFEVRTQTDIAETAKSTSAVFTSLLYSVAAVSLLVGGIGIMNIMLVSVTERTREIGIRIAIGARARDILFQFLVEALTLSAIGGALGIAFGIGGASVVSNIQGWPTLISSNAITAAVLVSGAVGVFFGYYPARKASRLDPIDALRYE